MNCMLPGVGPTDQEQVPSLKARLGSFGKVPTKNFRSWISALMTPPGRVISVLPSWVVFCLIAKMYKGSGITGEGKKKFDEIKINYTRRSVPLIST
jgi:hypothetical protein